MEYKLIGELEISCAPNVFSIAFEIEVKLGTII